MFLRTYYPNNMCICSNHGLSVDDSELRIPNYLLKIDGIDVGDGDNTFAEVLCNILFFMLAVVLSSFAAFVWPIILPAFIIVVLMKIARGLRRMVKKIKWVTKFTHSHPDNIEKIIENMPPYNEL